MISINTNISSMMLQNNLLKSAMMMNTALERLSTGYRINSVKDAVAGFNSAFNLNVQIRGLETANKNIANSINYLEVADGALSEMTDMLFKVRSRAFSAANDVYTSDQLRAMEQEANQLVDEINLVKDTANYNGVNVFGASGGSGTSNVALSHKTVEELDVEYGAGNWIAITDREDWRQWQII